MSRTDLLERYRELPLPTTSDEPWRFTDLKGFDPEAYVTDGQARGQTPDASMLDIDVAGVAVVTESGIEIERAPEGIVFAPLDEAHERLGTLVGADEKFAAHNAALWQHGLLVVVPKGIKLEQPLYVRIANTADKGSLFFRLLVIAEEGSSLTLIEEYACATPELAGYTNAVASSSSSRARSSSTCRCRTSRRRRGTSRRTTHGRP